MRAESVVVADDTALVADTEKLSTLVKEFGRVCNKWKLRVNVKRAR